MALLTAARQFQGELNQDNEGTSTITDTWAITVDDDTDGMDIAILGLPSYGVAHPDFPAASVRSRAIKRTGPKSFTGTVNYSDEIGVDGSSPQNPLTAPIQWSLAFDTRERIFEEEPDSSPKVEVKNTAGDWFDPQPTIPWYLAVLSVQANISSLSLNLVRQTVGKTNSSSFLGQPKNQVLCRSIRGTGPNYFGTTPYASTTYEFVMDRDAHVLKLLSIGLNQLDGNGNKVAIKDENDRKVTIPQNLDANGMETSDDAFVIEFNQFEDTSFSVFNLSISDLVGLSS